jgi:hypothetical protein
VARQRWAGQGPSLKQLAGREPKIGFLLFEVYLVDGSRPATAPSEQLGPAGDPARPPEPQ